MDKIHCVNSENMELPNLLCACQGEDDGMISVSFYYGLEGMGKRTPIKVVIPAIGSLIDAFEDIKEKLQKIARKISKRERRKRKLKQNLTQDEGSDPDTDKLSSEGIIALSSITFTENGRETPANEDENKQLQAPMQSPKGELRDRDNEDSKKLINLSIDNQGNELDLTTSNADGWRNNHNFIIDICGVVVHYAIYFNPPKIKTVELPKTIMVGYMVYPKLHLDNCSPDMCNINWYKCKKKPKHKMNERYKQLFLSVNCKDEDTEMENTVGVPLLLTDESNVKKADEANKKDPDSEWTFVRNGFHYVPTEDDLGYFLKVTCETTHLFEEQDVYVPCDYAESKHVVRHGPGVCPFERRHQETVNRTPAGSFRVMTYNILSDLYANTKSAVDYFYPYCPSYALSLDYRKQLLMKEILGYNCDIICLQEVDQKVYHQDFETIFTQNGYSGEMKTRWKMLSQGVSIYHKTDKFKNVGTHHIELTASLFERSIHKGVMEKISENEMLVTALQELKTILMVTALQPIDAADKVVLVANTHLSCGARKANRRIIQTITALQHLEDVIKQYYGDKDVSVVFCGDFNSLPESGVVQLITNGEISEKHADWFTGGRTEFVSGMHLRSSVSLKSAYKNPYYTNYVSGFYGTIDYIFHDHMKLEVTQTVSLPEHLEVTQDTACPSVKFPSDHLSLICDLKFVTP